MKDVFSRPLRSHHDLEGLFKIVQSAPWASWSKRESEYDDVYIRGLTPEGVKIRIVHEPPLFSVEVYFPTGAVAEHPALSDSEKETFLRRLSRRVREAVPGASFDADDWS